MPAQVVVLRYGAIPSGGTKFVINHGLHIFKDLSKSVLVAQGIDPIVIDQQHCMYHLNHKIEFTRFLN